MNKELSLIVEQLFGGSDEPTLDSNWYPRADIYRSNEGWLVKLELAGVRQEDIEVTL